MRFQDHIAALTNIIPCMAIHVYNARRDLSDGLREVWVAKDNDSIDPLSDSCRNQLGRVMNKLSTLAVSNGYDLRLEYFENRVEY